jgi:hypothetical protein
MEANTTLLVDEEHLTIWREDRPGQRPVHRGEVDFNHWSEADVRAAARANGLILSITDTPLNGAAPTSWVGLHFLPLEVP